MSTRRAISTVVTASRSTGPSRGHAPCQNATGALRFEGAGYYINYTNFTITAAPTILDVSLFPSETLLQGAITDASTQAAVANARVTFCTNHSWDCGSVTTDRDGHYAFDSATLLDSAVAAGPIIVRLYLNA